MPGALLISVSGAFSTGKTTLVEALRQVIPDAVIIADGGRAARAAVRDFDWARADARSFLYWYQLVREAEVSAPVVLCDTGLIDVLAHHQLYGIELPPDVALHNRRYDLALLCNAVEVELVDDGLRDTDHGRRAELDLLIREHARQLARNSVEIGGDPSWRLAKALDLVRTAREAAGGRV
ncbi:MAG: ATP-binding protein [Novosphingobium sp.]|jgi:nicotinamide riboside kinase|uniref:ATP-binding protein n=1 Tax=Novosphingobium sp. TaxID=1874826 RepID=UPI00301691C4